MASTLHFVFQIIDDQRDFNESIFIILNIIVPASG